MLFGFQSQCSYATLKDSNFFFNQNAALTLNFSVQTRLKSIKNIGKITKSMKMIASTKLNRAQKAMDIGRLYGKSATSLFDYIKVAEPSEKDKEQLIIACSSDRGLCGAIHSSISKSVKKMIAENPKNTKAAILGDKAKAQISRVFKNNVVLSFNQIGKDIPTFSDAISIAQIILKDLNLDNLSSTSVIYNHFKSVIAYESTNLPIHSSNQISSSEGILAYEFGDFVIEAYSQFMLASQIFWGLVEGHASEMSSKRMAMENASKNSDAIVLNLTMQYNRTRQAVITNELVDIITGASAL